MLLDVVVYISIHLLYYQVYLLQPVSRLVIIHIPLGWVVWKRNKNLHYCFAFCRIHSILYYFAMIMPYHSISIEMNACLLLFCVVLVRITYDTIRSEGKSAFSLVEELKMNVVRGRDKFPVVSDTFVLAFHVEDGCVDVFFCNFNIFDNFVVTF